MAICDSCYIMMPFSSSSSLIYPSTPCRRHLSMNATTLVPSYINLFRPPRVNWKVALQNRESSRFIQSVLTNKGLSKSPITHESKKVYHDNWFHRIAIDHVSRSLQASTGHKSIKSGYEGLVEAARIAHGNFNQSQQREIILKTLDMAIPRPILNLTRTLLPPSKTARELFAVTTTVLFSWLVGQCEVRESVFKGEKEKNIVYIPKCRFLEETNCVGMCINLCKLPSQEFIHEKLGTPVNMVPNFDDMSCEIIFGEEPPARSLDPALTQPCYKRCKATKRHHQETCKT